ncbi:MAG: recombinase family protein [Candidatus Omnitrophota bacterium]
MKVAIYTRVSTEDQVREGTSLEVQREYLEAFAKREGWTIYYPERGKIYMDDGYSGNLRDRPALNRLLFDARAKKFDIVLVYKIDRFARNNRMLLNLVEELSELEIGFKSATESFDTVSAAGKMALSMLGTVAQFERDRIIERVFPGMVKGVQRGNWQGARYSPYGYSYNKEKKVLEVVKEETEIVKLIYTMYLANQSTPQIAGYLYKKAYKTRSGGKFHTKLIGDILKNQVYLGKLVWNRHHYDQKQKTRRGYKYVKNEASKIIVADGRHQPIINPEDFLLVQDKLKGNRRGVMHRAGVKEYPLSGILFCAKCGHKYLGAANISNHREKIKKRWYRCNARQVHFIKCPNNSIRAEILEPQIYGIIETILQHPETTSTRMQNIVKTRMEIGDTDLKAEKEDLKDALRKNLEKQHKLNDTYLADLLAIEVYKDQSILLREEEKELKKAIAKADMKLVEKERSQEYERLLRRITENFEDTKKKIDIVTKKELLQLVFKRIVVNDGKIEDFELYKPFKRLYEEQKCKTKPIATATKDDSYILQPTAVR